jgi:hypothetical protein
MGTSTGRVAITTDAASVARTQCPARFSLAVVPDESLASSRQAVG